jgi:hypothetical protein
MTGIKEHFIYFFDGGAHSMATYIYIYIYICTVVTGTELHGQLRQNIAKNGFFWDVTPCGSCKNRRFGGT